MNESNTMAYTQEQVTSIVQREVAIAIELAAQKLYDIAEMQTTDIQINVYCGAAEIVRRTTDVQYNDTPYEYQGEV
jgi:hypothetical protein